MNILAILRKPLIYMALTVSASLILNSPNAHAQASNTVAPAPGVTPALPPGAQDALKLTKAGLSEDVILSQIKSSGKTYSLSVDQIILLSNAGVSQNVIKALMAPNAGSAPATPASPPPQPATAPVLPPTAPVSPVLPPNSSTAPVAPVVDPSVASATAPTIEGFQSQLAPYGTWFQAPGYGLCWRPSVASFDAHWHPYRESGHWMYTENGWYWESDYPWGAVPFHYGRWFQDGGGWAWQPGYDWAPAWVTWRQSDGYCGWAPLPPSAIFRPGVGLEFGGTVALDVDFGLGFSAYTFIPYDHFWDRDYRPFVLGLDRAQFVFRHSVVLNGYRYHHGRFYIEGLGRDRIGLYTHRDVRVEVIEHGGFGYHYVEPYHPGYRPTYRRDDHDRFH